MEPQPVEVDASKKATEYLANERTFLAWIRTSISIVSLGFVVAKFSLWLRQLSTQLQPHVQTSHPSASLPIGVTLMALGGMLAVLAAWHYHVVNRDIENGSVHASRRLVLLVTLMVALLSVAMIVYMLLTAERT